MYGTSMEGKMMDEIWLVVDLGLPMAVVAEMAVATEGAGEGERRDMAAEDCISRSRLVCAIA